MSGMEVDDTKEEHSENTLSKQVDGEFPDDDSEHPDKKEDHPMPSYEEEEAIIKKKYGGMLPKKQPLISKDHERAFFDSADWALGKQGQKPKGPLEALRPKLQPTPHQQVRSRRSAYAPSDGEDGGNPTSDDLINNE
ncbi:uncharacterized protein LOC143883056 [Tasmannia lanceolata]|uniref:uncharacterized protein LOC143883056 n=1 Tax=Tasmannia lanceolata TaxID=3420 RepID=UPI0040636F9A